MVPDDVAPVDHGMVRPNPEGDGLVLAGPCPILERDVPRDETGTGCGYMTRNDAYTQMSYIYKFKLASFFFFFF